MPAMNGVIANRLMACTGHYLATNAAFEILLAGGGNAVDAGVAANLSLAVLQSDQVNVAGVAPIMLYDASTGRVTTIAGVGPWPAAANIETFIEEFNSTIPLGILRTVVPAAPDANILALDRFGTMSFGDVAHAAIRYAREGFPMHGLMSHYIDEYEDNYGMWPSSADIYLPNDDGGRRRPPRLGERFVQSDLADTLQFMVDQEAAAVAMGGSRRDGLTAARNAFYVGDIAKTIVDYHRNNGGWLTMEDMRDYHSPIAPSESVTFASSSLFGRPIEVHTCGGWSQGPSLLQMLRLIEAVGLDWDGGELEHNSAEYVHTVAECIKLAFADRERYFGDPDFVDVPLDTLLSADYALRRVRSLFSPSRAWPCLPPPGDRYLVDFGGAKTESDADGHRSTPAAEGTVPRPRPPGDTSYACVIDSDGNVFSSNPSDVTWDSPVIPGTGLCPSSRGSQSWAIPGHPSSVGPGKRPRLTPNPVLVLRRNELTMPIGTPGGDVQPQAVLQVLLNVLKFGMTPQEAVEAPRFVTHSQPDSFAPHESFPGRLAVEGRIDDGVTDQLSSLGHDVDRMDDVTFLAGGVCTIVKDEGTGVMSAGADHRRPSSAMGW